MRIVLALVCWVLLVAVVAAQNFESVVRISYSHGDGRSTGSGTVFSDDGKHVYILTNAHVVGHESVVDVEFWRDGHKSRAIDGAVLWRAVGKNRDVAIVRVANRFDGWAPKPIPLAPRGTDLREGDTVVSVGCANGAWATAWKGHIVAQRDSLTLFKPSPAGGRSGSALFSADGKQIVGLVAWRLGGNGGAMSLEEVYRALSGERGGSASVKNMERVDCWEWPESVPASERLVPVMRPGTYVESTWHSGWLPVPDAVVLDVPVTRMAPIEPAELVLNPPLNPVREEVCICGRLARFCQRGCRPAPRIVPQPYPSTPYPSVPAPSSEFPTFPGQTAEPTTPPVVVTPVEKKCECDTDAIVSAVVSKLESESEKWRGKDGVDGRDGKSPTIDYNVIAEQVAARIDLPTTDALVDATTKRVIAVIESRERQQPEPETNPEWTHMVLVAPTDASYWKRLSGDFENAQDYYSGMRHREPPTSMSIGPIPALVAYAAGKPVKVWRGQREVATALSKITRGDYDDFLFIQGGL